MKISGNRSISALAFALAIFFLWNACQRSKQLTQVPVEESKNYMPDTIGKFANVKFDSGIYHFGELQQGDTMHRKIFFTNQGPGDLLIELVTACECTTLEWPRLPVRPGKRGRIDIVYNSRDKKGPQTVDVDIIANTNPIVSSAKFKLSVKEKN